MIKPMLYGANGKALIPNLDPNFFIPGGGGQNVTVSDITERPYQYHSWVNASARVISQNIARLPKIMVDPKDKTDVELEHEVLEAFEQPNIFMPTSIVFWQAIVLYLLLPSNNAYGKDNTGGQVFLVCLNKNGEKIDLHKGEIPEVIYPYSDKFIKPRISDKGDLVGWDYEIKSADKDIKIELDLNEIIRIHFFNPYDWLAGMSYFSPAMIAFHQDVQADIYNTMFYENDATVAGLLTSDEHLTDEQYTTYMKRWYDNYGGVGKTNRTAILGAGLTYQQYGTSHADMQFSEQKEYNRDQILANFGLNKIAIGQYENINFATIKEGRRVLWQDTYIPIDLQINKAINDQWIKYIDNGKKLLATDYSSIPALREDYKMRAQAGQAMVQGMDFPPSLAASLNDIPLTEKNLADYPWLDERPVKTSAKQEDETEKQRVRKMFKSEDEDEHLKFSWDFIHRVLDPGEKQYIKMLERFFFSERNRMQDKVDKWLTNQEKLIKVLSINPNQFLLSIAAESKTLLKLMRPLIEEQMVRDKKKLEEELGELIEWDVTDERIEEFVNSRKDEIKKINTTTFEKNHKKIGEAIEISVKNNETPQQTAKRIKEAIGVGMEIRKNQSKMIARTETGVISGKSRYGAFRVEGIKWHQWLTAEDDRVRTGVKDNPSFDHAATDKKIVKVGKLFMPVKLKHPLDTTSAGSKPGNIINCRCVAVAAEEPKA